MKIYIMIGCPGSGKSTWIKRNLGEDFPVVSRDIIREELGMCGEGEKALGTGKQEKEVTRIEEERIKGYIREGLDFAIDDTNLNPKYRKPMIQSLRSSRPGITIIGVRVNTPLSECFRRRTGQIPPAVLRSMWEKVGKVDPQEFDEFIEVDGTLS